MTSIAADQITFHTITPLADTGGYEISAQVRSKYFDPKDRAELRKSIVLKTDGQDFIVKPIYNVSRPSGEPLFEYLLELLGGKNRLQRKAILRAADAASTTSVAVYRDRNTPMAVRVTWHGKSGKSEGKPEVLDSEYLYLTPPDMTAPASGQQGGQQGGQHP